MAKLSIIPKHGEPQVKRVKVKKHQKRLISWREMDTYMHGYKLADSDVLHPGAVGGTLYIRVDKYADEGGKEASVLWWATYTGSQRNANTGTLEHLFDYTCTPKHLVFPQNASSLQFFGGNIVSTRNTDVFVYTKVKNACDCKLVGCYMCYGGSDR